MRNISICQELGRSYLVAECIEDEETEYLVSMIKENSIKGIISCKEVFEDTRRMLYFDVTNNISLTAQYSNKHIGLEDMCDIFGSISMVFSEGRKYLLDEKYYLIDPEYIFFDPVTHNYSFIYLPMKETDINGFKDYEEIADFLLQNVDQNNHIAVKTTYAFYKMIRLETFSIEAFREIIEKEKSLSLNKRDTIEKHENDRFSEMDSYLSFQEDIEINQHEIKYPVIAVILAVILFCVYYYYIESVYSTYILLAAILMIIITVILSIRIVIEKVRYKNDLELENDMKNAKEEDYWITDETQVFDDRTQVFDESQLKQTKEYSLSWKENGVEKKYRILSYPVTLGKLGSEVDCLLHDKSVSRIHAKIDQINSKVYIWDMNSTNGTSVNGVTVAPGDKAEINESSDIRIGNVGVRLI